MSDGKTISIHAPARGATLTTFATRLYPCISIHAPARGATGCQIHGFYNILISIHAPARGATSDRSQTEKVGNISIHAPARGATRRAGKIGLPFSYFNPRSREGSDGSEKRELSNNERFQSTLPRGERRGAENDSLRGTVISIHAPARGATDFRLEVESGHVISIHAPARGATLSWAYGNADDFISIHAPARGATVAQAPNQCYHSYFNPRSREGSDKRRRSSQASRIRFQSTLPRGERQEKAQLCTDATTISIHAPARGATRPPVHTAQGQPISIHAPARGATPPWLRKGKK